jgi:hypothetical protein
MKPLEMPEDQQEKDWERFLKITRVSVITLIVLFIPWFLTSCASQPSKVVNIKIPANLIKDCYRPPFEGEVNKDLVDYVLILDTSLKSCNAQLKAIREINQ